jgi:hypothetical protein
MKDRMGRYRGLMSTTDALKDLTSFRKIGFRMTASGTVESIPPSELFQIDIENSLLLTESVLETQKN